MKLHTYTAPLRDRSQRISTKHVAVEINLVYTYVTNANSNKKAKARDIDNNSFIRYQPWASV